MTALEIVLPLLVAAAGSVVVFSARTIDQLIVFAAFGLTLALLFFVLHAPDVAFSEVAVGGVAIPFAVLVTLVKTRGVL